MTEHLVTGWEPDAPSDDTFVRAFALSMAELFAAPAALMGRRTARRDTWWGSDFGVPAGYANSVLALRPLVGPGSSSMLDEIEAFVAEGSGTVMFWNPWPTPDLGDRGWVRFGHPPLLLRPPGGPVPPVPPELRVVAVRDEATLEDFERTSVEAYPLPDAEHLLPGGLFGPAVLSDERFRLFVGYVDDAPVATAGALVADGLNDVSYVSTVPSARGRGYGEAVTWAATTAEPAWPAALVASDLGLPVYRRMGYTPIVRFTLWGRPRG